MNASSGLLKNTSSPNRKNEEREKPRFKVFKTVPEVHARHIDVSHLPPSEERAYILQRYMNAAAGRGRMPIKFNGSIFNVELTHDMAGCRAGWMRLQTVGRSLLVAEYAPALQFHALFGRLGDDAPVVPDVPGGPAAGRVPHARYFGHEGAYFPETMCFWGTYAIDNYGWDRTGLGGTEFRRTATSATIFSRTSSWLRSCSHIMNSRRRRLPDRNALPGRLTHPDLLRPALPEVGARRDRAHAGAVAGDLLRRVRNPLPDIAGCGGSPCG